GLERGLDVLGAIDDLLRPRHFARQEQALDARPQEWAFHLQDVRLERLPVLDELGTDGGVLVELLAEDDVFERRMLGDALERGRTDGEAARAVRHLVAVRVVDGDVGSLDAPLLIGALEGGDSTLPPVYSGRDGIRAQLQDFQGWLHTRSPSPPGFPWSRSVSP